MPSSSVSTLVALPDGAMLIGGSFSSIDGVPRAGIARINADGSLDTAFDPGTGVNAGAAVRSIVVQPDGQILVGGSFTSFNGVARSRIARLTSTGALDAAFVGPALNGEVLSMARQSTGRVVIGGWFSTVNGSTRHGIARINADGSADTTFAVGVGLTSTTAAWSIAVQSDDKVIVAGNYSSINGSTLHRRIARLNADGSLDAALAMPSTAVLTVALQEDGKMLLSGWFSSVGGVPRGGLARLNADGTLDVDFVPPSLETSSGVGGNGRMFHFRTARCWRRACRPLSASTGAGLPDSTATGRSTCRSAVGSPAYLAVMSK